MRLHELTDLDLSCWGGRRGGEDKRRRGVFFNTQDNLLDATESLLDAINSIFRFRDVVEAEIPEQFSHPSWRIILEVDSLLLKAIRELQRAESLLDEGVVGDEKDRVWWTEQKALDLPRNDSAYLPGGRVRQRPSMIICRRFFERENAQCLVEKALEVADIKTATLRWIYPWWDVRMPDCPEIEALLEDLGIGVEQMPDDHDAAVRRRLRS